MNALLLALVISATTHEPGKWVATEYVDDSYTNGAYTIAKVETPKGAPTKDKECWQLNLGTVILGYQPIKMPIKEVQNRTDAVIKNAIGLEQLWIQCSHESDIHESITGHWQRAVQRSKK